MLRYHAILPTQQSDRHCRQPKPRKEKNAEQRKCEQWGRNDDLLGRCGAGTLVLVSDSRTQIRRMRSHSILTEKFDCPRSCTSMHCQICRYPSSWFSTMKLAYCSQIGVAERLDSYQGWFHCQERLALARQHHSLISIQTLRHGTRVHRNFG
jgi:hypothetical protein